MSENTLAFNIVITYDRICHKGLDYPTDLSAIHMSIKRQRDTYTLKLYLQYHKTRRDPNDFYQLNREISAGVFA